MYSLWNYAIFCRAWPCVPAPFIPLNNMSKRVSWLYISAALATSVAWYPVLLLLPQHRKAIVPGGFLEFSIGGIFLFLGIAGLCVALCWRNKISKAEGWTNVALGASLPYVGAFIFCVLVSLAMAGKRGNFGEFIVLPFWGILYSLAGFYVIVPYGIACQYIMRWAGRYNQQADRT